MKKTLAILLAMLMILSVVFVSCGKKDKDGDATEDLGGGDFTIPGGGTGNIDENDDGTGTGNNGTVNGSNSGFSPITEKTEAYMLMSVNVRTNYKKSATNGAAMYGSKVTRLETNDTWTKIKYTDANGAAKEGYVYDEVLTTDQGRVTFVANETPEKTVSDNDKVSVRKTPWVAIEQYSNLIDEIIGTDGDSYKLKKNQEVEILGVTQSADDSGNKWAYIKYKVGEKDVYGWCRRDLLKTETTDVPNVDPSMPGVPSPV